ncbi:MAG: protein kinase, partial [Acidobacteria bacterium]|nr:protein kinase [Acidobacteriota bacterium]
MSSPDDPLRDLAGPLLDLASKVAEGDDIDWESRRDELPSTGDEAAVVAGLRRLAELQHRFRAAQDTVPDPASQAAAPWRWGHLEVREFLGAGSFGEVFRAYDPVLRREVALKLRAAGAGDAEEAFLSEARRLARVRHPHVLAIHGADVHDGRAGLWADLLRGQTLEELLRQ